MQTVLARCSKSIVSGVQRPCCVPVKRLLSGLDGDFEGKFGKLTGRSAKSDLFQDLARIGVHRFLPVKQSHRRSHEETPRWSIP